MDTSKRSQLEMILGILYPHLNDLPFRRLREHLADFSELFNGEKYHFRYGSTTVCQLGSSGEDRVFAIPVIRKFHTGRNGRLKKLELVQLILEKTKSGGTQGSWLIHRVEFVLAPDSERAYFNSSGSVIMHVLWNKVEDELRKMGPPKDFLEVVKLEIGKWIKDTIASREKVLTRLKELSQKFPVPEEAVLKK